MESKIKKDCIISIDMGGTKILSAAINSADGIIFRVKKPTKSGSKPGEHVKSIVQVIDETIKSAKLNPGNIKAVCLGIPGSVNPFTGRIGIAPNLGLKNFNIKQELLKLLPYPVLIENDVNMGALGIKYFGLGKDAKDMLVVFIGTGIGAALIFNGIIFRGANYAAGEIGHITVDKNGPLCGCGKKGCFEAVAGRNAIVRDILRDLKRGKKSVLSKMADSNRQIKSKAIAAAVKNKDKLVTKHLLKACDTIGMVLGNAANLLNLDLIILGGGLIEALDKFMIANIKTAFDKYALKDSAAGIKIKATKLGDDAALFGGIALADEFLNIKV